MTGRCRVMRSLAAASFLALASCTEFPPTKTENPLTVPSDRKDIVSVCYDADDHSRAEIQSVARGECSKNTVSVRPWRIDKVFNDCPMFKKTRVSFLCVAAPSLPTSLRHRARLELL